MDLETVTDELYGGELDEFTPKRTALSKEARAEGDKKLASAIGKLRKPSTSAWAINALVRSSPDEVDRLLELGGAFRRAQDDLDGPELRGLSRQRQALIGAVVESVREVAGDHGRAISEPIAEEVEQTFRAAMADPEAAEAVRSGSLTTAISASGLGSLKISDVAAAARPQLEVVRTPAPSRRSAKGKPDPKAEAERAELEAHEERSRAAKVAADQLAQAERAADLAADRLREADDALDEANARRSEVRDVLAGLQQQIAQAEKDHATADDAIADAKEDRKLAKKGVANAERAVKAARAAQP